MYDPKPIDMSDALRQVYEGKKLDPVGQEDKDIDNDGDHDKSDKYLLNRRKVRGKAIKTRNEETEAVEEGLAKMAADVTDALPWNRNTKYTTKGKLRQPGENVHGVQTGRGLNKTTVRMGAKGPAGGQSGGTRGLANPGPMKDSSNAEIGGSKLKGSPKGFGWSRLKKEEVEEFVDSLLSANREEQLDVVLEFIGGRKGDGYIGHPNLDIKNPLAKTQTKGPVGNKTGSGMVHRVGGALGDRKMKMDAMMKGLSKGGPVKKESVHVDAAFTQKEELVDDLLQLSEEQLNELLGGLVGGLMNMGKKGGFMKGASTGIGGLAGQAMGKKPTTKGLLGFSKGGLYSKGGEKKKACKSEEVIHDELDDIFEGPVGEFADNAARLAGNVVGGTERALKKGPAYLKQKVKNVKSTFDSARERTRENTPPNVMKAKKESLAFSEDEEFFINEECDFDNVSDEELVAFFEDAILEMAEDDQDLFEICEELEICGILMEEEEKDDDKKKPSAMDRLKSAAAKAGENLKKGAKAVIGAGGRAIGHGVGEFQAQRKKSKKAAMERGDGEREKSDDGDETGGKLDDILSSIRGDARGKSDSGGSSESSGGRGKKKPTFIQRVGGVLKGALKKGVGKLSRAVSSGSDKLASRLGEDYEQIAHLYESGLFSIQEIEHVIEEGYKEIDKKKENEMYRKAGNLARKSLSADDPDEKEKARKKSGKIVSAIARQKERERFSKMGDEKARDNYGG